MKQRLAQRILASRDISEVIGSTPLVLLCLHMAEFELAIDPTHAF
jgi:hypothetical protein